MAEGIVLCFGRFAFNGSRLCYLIDRKGGRRQQSEQFRFNFRTYTYIH